jgi:hypothetical protein
MIPEPAPAALDTSITADTAIGDCTVALHPPRERERLVIDALRLAYGLEQALYQRADSVTSWDQVYAHYRRGFSEPLARRLADYSWEAESGTLRATDAAMAVPDSVGVLQLERKEALVAWIPRNDFRQRWELPRCIVDRLERQDDHWVVVERRP